MKHLVKYKLFEEVNKRDIAFIQREFSSYFTISFEFEIETLDESGIEIDFTELDDEIIEDVIQTTKKDLVIRRKSEKDLVNDLAYKLLDEVEFGTCDLETFNQIFRVSDEVMGREKEIIKHLKTVIMSFISIDDFEYLKSKVIEHLPNFVNKWSDRIDYVGDATLDRGIEIKPKTFVNSLSEGVEMINDFYDDLESQSYWKLTEKTGLHINIGTKDNVIWNPIKGLLILNDFNKTETTPYLFKDIEWRMTSNFCGSILSYISNLPDREKQSLKSKINLYDIEKTESELNQFLTNKVKIWGAKHLGFNISKLEQNYVEFRYVGGVVSRQVVIDKLKYFSFIVYVMTNPDYKRKEYLKKLYKFVETL